MKDNKIELKLDKNRIKEILDEAYDSCKEILVTDFDITKNEFSSKIDAFLDSNRISGDIHLVLPSAKYPELVIEVNLKKKRLIARMANKNIRILLNRFLTKL